MPGRNKLLKQCESIARHSGLRCRAKGKLKKSGHYRCRFHGGESDGPVTIEGSVKAYRNLINFKNYTDDEIRNYIKGKARKYYRKD